MPSISVPYSAITGFSNERFWENGHQDIRAGCWYEWFPASHVHHPQRPRSRPCLLWDSDMARALGIGKIMLVQIVFILLRICYARYAREKPELQQSDFGKITYSIWGSVSYFLKLRQKMRCQNWKVYCNQMLCIRTLQATGFWDQAIPTTHMAGPDTLWLLTKC